MNARIFFQRRKPGSSLVIKTNRHERGQSFVELALVIPVLLILLAGIIDIGRFFMCYMELRDAAQEGANYGSIYPDPDPSTGKYTEIESHVKTLSTYPIDLANDSKVKVTISPITCNSGTVTSSVVVTVTYPFKVSAPFVGMFFKNQTIDMSATATGKVLDASC